MKYLNLFLALILTSTLVAQSNKSFPSLQIVGQSELDVMPDVGILSINIQEIKMEFNDAITALDKKTENVQKQLSKLDFSEEDIKTRSFQIRKNTIYDRNKRRDSGYVASQAIIVKFNYSKERISQILSEFADASVGMQLSFSFTLSDSLKEASKNELIVMASKDAQKKAALLAQSFNKSLDEVVSLSYGSAPSRENLPVYRTMEISMADAQGASYKTSGFTPEFIKMKETVYASWSLK
jgi:uncharacterized protein YggE